MSSEGNWLVLGDTSERVHTILNEQRVTLIPAILTTPVRITSFAFPESEVGRLEGKLDLTGSRLATNIQGVIYIHKRAGDRPFLIEAEEPASAEASPPQDEPYQEEKISSAEAKRREKCWVRKKEENSGNMEFWKNMQPILKKWAKALGLNIMNQNLHGAYVWDREEPEPGTLRILYWASPDESVAFTSVNARSQQDTVLDGDERTVTNTVTHWGIEKTDGALDGFRISGEGDYQIMDDAGIAVAEVVDNTLFIPFDLPHSVNAGKLIDKIMEGYAVARKQAVNPKARLSKTRTAWAELYNTAVNPQVQILREQVQKHRNDAEAYQMNAHKLLVEVARKEATISKFENTSTEAVKKKWAEQFDALSALEDVNKVQVRGGAIHVTTPRMDFMGKGKLRAGCSLDIAVAPRTGAITVTASNRDRRNNNLIVGGYCHPHCRNGSHPCLGNIDSGIKGLIQEIEVVPMYTILLQFFRTCGESDFYMDPINWPEIAEDGSVKWKPPRVRGDAGVVICRRCGQRYPGRCTCVGCSSCGTFYTDKSNLHKCGKCEACCDCD